MSQIDVRRLFHGHGITVGNQILIHKSSDHGEKQFNANLTAIKRFGLPYTPVTVLVAGTPTQPKAEVAINLTE